MKLSQFLMLLLSTAVSTYLMNSFILEGDLFWAGLCAFFVLQNLRTSYRISRFIRSLERTTKTKD